MDTTIQDTMFFFDRHPAVYPLYERFQEKLLASFPESRIKVQQSQISYYNLRRQNGEHTAEKIRQKFLAKRNTTRFDRSLKNGRSFFLSTFTSVENLAKNMFSFSIEMLHSRRGFPHRRLCPSRLRSPISSVQAMETGLALPEGGSFESKWKVAESED